MMAISSKDRPEYQEIIEQLDELKAIQFIESHSSRAYLKKNQKPYQSFIFYLFFAASVLGIFAFFNVNETKKSAKPGGEKPSIIKKEQKDTAKNNSDETQTHSDKSPAGQREIPMQESFVKDGFYYLFNEQEPFTGILIQKNYLGELSERLEVKKGLLDGVARSWYESGEIKSEQVYKDGKLNGLTKNFYPDGRLKSEGQYENDQLHGFVKEYDANGEQVNEEIYEKGQLKSKKE